MKEENNRIELKLEMTPGTRVSLTGYIAKELDLNDEQVSKLNDILSANSLLYGWMWIGQRVEVDGVVHVPSNKKVHISSVLIAPMIDMSEKSVLHAQCISECAVDQLKKYEEVKGVIPNIEGKFEVNCGSMDPKESQEYIQGVKEMWEKARESDG